MQKHTQLLVGFLAVSAVLGILGIFFLWAAPRLYGDDDVSLPAEAEKAPVIVLDAGHGGEDGGATGADGTLEKELNLAVTEAVYHLLSAAGYDVRMTRTDDRMLYDLYGDLAEYGGYKKTYDLKNRLRYTREADADLFVSIHMNKFPQENVRGLQVWHAAVPGSREIAETIRSYAADYLSPEHKRIVKETTSAIYLLHRIEIPAVMIECGFLSNCEDLAKLKDESYREQLALTIACALSAALTARSAG